MDSMKAISAFFGITMDELLSEDELLSIAQGDTKQKSFHLRELVFGLLDCCAAGFFFLPVFGNHTQEFVQAVSLPALSEISPYLKTAYFIALSGMVVLGIAMLALQNSPWKFWKHNSRKLSLILHTIATLLFTISRQPYAAAALLILLIIKGIFLAKQP